MSYKLKILNHPADLRIEVSASSLEELFINYPHLKQNINLIDLLNSLPVKISTLFSEPYFNSYVLKINEGISYALINGKWENFMKDPEIK